MKDGFYILYFVLYYIHILYAFKITPIIYLCYLQTQLAYFHVKHLPRVTRRTSLSKSRLRMLRQHLLTDNIVTGWDCVKDKKFRCAQNSEICMRP